MNEASLNLVVAIRLILKEKKKEEEQQGLYAILTIVTLGPIPDIHDKKKS